MVTEYERGYNNGYRAGRGFKAPAMYQRVYWRCNACSAQGLVLWRSDDDNAKRQWRIEQSHRAQSRADRCPYPRIVRLAARQVRAALPDSTEPTR